MPTVDGAESSFQKLLDSEGEEVDVLDLLRDQLSEEQLEQLEELLANGNELFPDGKDLPLPAILTLIQQAVDSGVLTPSEEGAVGDATGKSNSALNLMSMLLRDGRARADGNLPADQEAPVASLGDGADDLPPMKEVLRLLPGDKGASPALSEALRPATLATLTSSGAVTPSTAAVEGPLPLQQLSAAGVFSNASPSQVSGSATTPPPITVPPGEQGWDKAMGERILWMAGRDIQRAAIQIRPPNLGPLQIQMSIQNDQASLHFTASSGVVQDALEASMPRLREMLAEQNLQLVNVDVSRRDADNRDGLAGSQQGAGDKGRDGDGIFGEERDAETDEPIRYYRREGLLDDYA